MASLAPALAPPPALAPAPAPVPAPAPAPAPSPSPAAAAPIPSSFVSSFTSAPGIYGVQSFNNGIPVASQPPSSTTLLPPGPPLETPSSAVVAVSTPTRLASSTLSTSGPLSGSKSSVSSSNIPKSQTPTPSSTGQARAATTPTPKPDHRLANGTVAGIAVALGLGLALATFIATFLIMRRRRASRHEQDHQGSKEKTIFELADTNRQSSLSEPKKVPVTEAPRFSNTLENYLPQSADDKTVQNNVKTMLDQVELYVENFYQNHSGLSSVRPHTDIAAFNSPNLPNSLATLLLQSRHATFLIKHALAQFITSSISPRSRPGSSLLPDEFMLVPAAVESTRNSGSTKPGNISLHDKGQICFGVSADTLKGFDQCMSRWRVLTAYLRPIPSQDPLYIAHRDHQIQENVEAFSRAFTPWRNLKHEDKVRNQSLSAILRSAAELGIFMFAQPSDLRFYWPKQSEVGANRVVVAPSLVKRTDERGQALAEPQVMLKAVIEKT